jgi:hypothetical protein
MKNLKYIFLSIIMLSAAYSCVEDEIMTKEGPVVEGSVLKLNEIMSKDVNDAPDWVEVYNSGTTDMDISGYIINDKATAAGGYAIPAGTTISAGGFYLVDANESGESISSGGEDVSLAEPDGTIIDHTVTPDMSSNVGLTWAREIDGAGEWKVSSPTPKSSNGSVANTAPILSAEALTEFTDVYAVTASDADGISSVKLVFMAGENVQSLDMALVEGEYKTTVPKAKVGELVRYYVVAKDNTGLITYYPNNGNNAPAEYTVVGGVKELTFAGEMDGNRGDVTFTVTPYYTDQVDEIRLYYLLPGEQQDEANGFDDKTKVVLVQDGDTFSGVIPALNTEGEISYYIRVEYLDGTKTYYPIENGGDFNHDLGTTWPSYMVEAIEYDTVVETTVTSTEGPVTSITFPTNPLPGSDINVVIAYASTEEIVEARIYFAVGDSPEYVKANKISGEDDATFTQTGVTINLKDAVTDGDGLSLSESGAKVSFYVRIATATKEYYYSNTGAMSIDETPGGGTLDESDAFKADPSLWNVYNVQ